MKAKEKNQTKVFETEKLLLEIIKDPHGYKGDAELYKALKSQAAIAKLENPDRQIFSCSLNTVKSVSEALLDRGFLGLDKLRINAKAAIEAALHSEKTGKPNKQSITGLKLKIDELEEQLIAMRFACFNLTTVVDELHSQAKTLAVHNGTLDQRIELYKEVNARLEVKLSHAQQSDDFNKFITEFTRFLDATT
ncbi:hypothetical protein [Aliivibrio fischeri]|uniref:hypothetical protein n=1 Tax=Aliivibrio fischeri TaxID=668 RepID=UPI000AE94EA5|nr:hypothetical protein [Aliivibrio fischeri]USR94513.1 hypothetical protein AVFI_08085 [Aliivibrio fischeri ATCC 7744 = JCM 18803 = DSM 507]USR98124.1 hypothetical protein AVFI_16850 [Aliivibrio fischeri ATCC 7744 = JCM 18803 = DSM 507]GGK50197.1 hypothetical protein GCM10007987_36640 [Aliivibrio fischeri]